MKIGLDSTRKEFSKGLVRKLEEENLFIVDMYLEKRKNEGYEIYKKVMDANKSRLDLFIGVYLLEEDEPKENLVVLYDCTFLGEKIANHIYDNLRNKYGNKNLSLKCGKELYILKEIKAPCIIIKGNLENEIYNVEKDLTGVIKEIFKMEIE